MKFQLFDFLFKVSLGEKVPSLADQLNKVFTHNKKLSAV